ncbi:probable calcium-binding protein CML48 [Momordica charantia]|uniref:Probable calcium-binding protein CML48 n=1 Tax=Momordica charantia TaxID=3673 RepID=A0A6J1CM69_MOMCH|nr:probable calcium-binding protein CML48 [Momordica charantia]XP_022142690.1 probable calcium-binding protein CML48 [Momordica charantia]
MASFFGRFTSHSHSNSNAPSAPSAPSPPPAPETHDQGQSHGTAAQYYSEQQRPRPYGSDYGGVSSYGSYGFPPGTSPEVIRSFQMVDRDGSGFIDENELQQALSSGYQRFSLRTVRLLIFLFRNPVDSTRMGPNEFAAIWSCLGQWRATFERYDRDRSGKIDALEMRDALYGLGYAVPSSVLQLLSSLYDDHCGGRVEYNFDSFVECGMIVKGLTEKFKEKDRNYTGSATLTYEDFMSTILPFLVSYS